MLAGSFMGNLLNIQQILERIATEVQPLLGQGDVVSYIPALSGIASQQFGMAVRMADGSEYCVGDAELTFSIQSISKLFTLMLALDIRGEALWERVGREPSGTAFNSLVQLEHENGVPRNPFINAGAIVVTDVIASRSAGAQRRIADFIRLLSGNWYNRVDELVARSERQHGHRNAALAYLMKSFGRLDSDVDDVLEVYCRQCSITMSCVDLVRATSLLVCGGYSDVAKQQVLSATDAKRINALMLTCGLYNAVGNFAYRVGLPAKSGVGGGIVAVLPGQFSVCVWSPGLDEAGNSIAGVRALELFTSLTGLSIF